MEEGEDNQQNIVSSELKEEKSEVVRYPTVIAILDAVDTICIVYFTLEYLVRFLCAPRKLRFIFQPMNQERGSVSCLTKFLSK